MITVLAVASAKLERHTWKASWVTAATALLLLLDAAEVIELERLKGLLP